MFYSIIKIFYKRGNYMSNKNKNKGKHIMASILYALEPTPHHEEMCKNIAQQLNQVVHEYRVTDENESNKNEDVYYK